MKTLKRISLFVGLKIFEIILVILAIYCFYKSMVMLGSIFEDNASLQSLVGFMGFLVAIATIILVVLIYVGATKAVKANWRYVKKLIP